ncbi:MAG: nicotinamide riboside transporter PnuC [Deferribacteraceae bacterium]|jgi:nicotinamide mononucleotide transporter|nr:nicotinamide riboside transporter PnuC [Deferribacteraceae bacterium]
MNYVVKLVFAKWNVYELCWLGIFSAISVVITILTNDSLFNFTVFITGVLCVVFAAKGSIWTYIFGSYNTFTYAWLAYSNNLYGEMGLNLFFFAPMNIIGFFMWRHKLKDGIVLMRKLANKARALMALVIVASTASLGYVLSMISGQATPYIDASTNVLSVVSQLLMAFRYKEQWTLYIVLNVLTVTMWSIRLAAGSPEAPIMIAMWSAYLINAFYGWYNWNKGAK